MTTSTLAGKAAGNVVTQIGGTDGALTRAALTDTSGRLVTTFTDNATATGSASTTTLAVSGARVASVSFVFTGASAQQQISLDGGVNWISGAYVKRLDLVSANPTVTASITTPGTYEMPIPGNCTNVRLAASSGNVTISAFQPYVPSTPVTATLYDVTSAVNTALDTGVLDFSGWQDLTSTWQQPSTITGSIIQYDDAGAAMAANTLVATPSNFNGVLVSDARAPLSPTGTAVASIGYWPFPWVKRSRWQTIAVAAVQSRIRIEVRR